MTILTDEIVEKAAAERDAKLLRLFSYCPETGHFTWRQSVGVAKAGSIAGSRHPEGYCRIVVDKKLVLGHRLAWFFTYGRWPSGRIDHINGDAFDNRISNLREATNAQNAANSKRPITNTSGFKGVSWHKGDRRWTARIKVNGKTRHLGSYLTAERAHEAYLKAARAHFGEFARAE